MNRTGATIMIAMAISGSGALGNEAISANGASIDSATHGDWLPDLAAEATSGTAESSLRGRSFAEIAIDTAPRRDGRRPDRHLDIGIDWLADLPAGAGWKAHSSGRLDLDSYPGFGLSHRNLGLSLRELSLEGDLAGAHLQLGRINVRDGVAIGFNPTDVFRGGALPIRRSQDPARLRESRLGIAAAAVSLHGDWGNLAFLASPALSTASDRPWYDPNWGAVNDGHAQRYLRYTLPQWHDLYTNVVATKVEGGATTYGANLSTGIGNAIVGYLEAASTTVVPIADWLDNAAAPRQRLRQAALGFTWTGESRQSLTLEHAYNGAGLNRQEWLNGNRNAGDDDWNRALATSAWRQDPLNRHSTLVMGQWDRFIAFDADLTCLARFNHDDRSRMGWCEWRYKQDATEWSVNLSRFLGDSRSEFGAAHQRYAIGAKVRFFF